MKIVLSMTFFKRPNAVRISSIRHISSPVELWHHLYDLAIPLYNLTFSHKEALSLVIGGAGFVIKHLKQRQEAASKQLIFCVRQAKDGVIPSDFNQLSKDATSIDAVDADGNSALHYACANGHEKLVQALLGYGANLALKNKREETPFHLAAFAGHLFIITTCANLANQYTSGMFIRSKISLFDIINQTTRNGSTPIAAALFNNHVSVAGNLISLGANITRKNAKGETALSLAVENGDTDLVRHMIFNVDISEEVVLDLMRSDTAEGNPLYIAAERGFLHIVELFLKRGAENAICGRDRQTPLHIAILNERQDITLALYANDKDAHKHLTPEGWSVIDYVIGMAQRRQALLASERHILDDYFSQEQNELDTAKLSRIPFYQNRHISTDSLDKTNLRHIAITNDAEAIDALLEPNPVNIDMVIAFHEAILFGSIDAVKALVKKGVDVNLMRQNGSSPLMTAAFFQRTEIALFLIKSGANVNHANRWGTTALDYAIIHDDMQLALALCRSNINVRHVDTGGYHYMHKVGKYGSGDMAELLLDKGVLRDAKTRNFENLPIHLASRHANLPVMRVLFKYHAEHNIRNINGLVPMQLARNNKDVIKLLIDAEMKAQTKQQEIKFFINKLMDKSASHSEPEPEIEENSVVPQKRS